MHYIQKQILDSLRKSQAQRYAQLKSDEIESGHFRYHLSQLVKDGYVDLLERGLYRLSSKGQKLVDKLSENKFIPSAMPKVITYTLLTESDKVWLYKKQKQPYMNLLNMVGGKLHEGETAKNGAVREIAEKTGNKISEPILKGVFEILINKDGSILTHAVAFVYCYNIEVSHFKSDKLEEIDIKSLKNTARLAPDFLPIFENINKQNKPGFETIILEI